MSRCLQHTPDAGLGTAAVTVDYPLFSVITIALDAGQALRSTVDSVQAQNFDDYQYLVKDGGSTDGSTEFLKTLDDPRIRCFSGSDSGIADAMNQALEHATGEYVLFLHAGDRFLDADALARAAKAIRSNPGKAIYAFGIRFGPHPGALHRPRGFNPWINFKTGIWHQSAFCCRDLFERLGGFDTSLKIAMDYEWFLRAYRARASALVLPDAISYMDDAGISSRRDTATLHARFAEEQAIHWRHATGPGMRLLYACYWPLYRLYRGLPAHSRKPTR